jgi:muramoyltetrapeptide carboxypeptidase
MGSKSVIRPPRLAAGTRVALVAPAGPLPDFDDLRRATALCTALGWEPVAGRHALAQHGYLAGTDEERLSDLNAALNDDSLGAVWCIRGGYGLTRILAGVDFDAAARHPKVVLGFSDVTALLLALHGRTGLVTFHGPVARQPLNGFSRAHLERVTCRDAPAGTLTIPVPPGDLLVPKEHRVVALAAGVAEGPLVGGNLSLLQCLVGTPYLPALDGAVLFLEDVGEEVYRIDRMLSHLRLAGVLDRVAGVALGQFTETGLYGSHGAPGLDRVLSDYLVPLGIPVVMGLPVGHVADQWTLPVGVRARLDGDAATLTILEPAVR